jgi:hypothetical protein
VANARERLGPVLLYFLPTAAPIAQLAAVKFGIDEFQINAQPGGQAGNPGDQGLPVRLSGSGELQHSALSVCGKKLPARLRSLLRAGRQEIGHFNGARQERKGNAPYNRTAP